MKSNSEVIDVSGVDLFFDIFEDGDAQFCNLHQPKRSISVEISE